ncbi:hypothetical protein ILUMI_08704 [Ignelater luminosus]|uniref:Uncharacterized protein n=1 Tax=Ignelater luminosus TaxID=2038154 RepID=A0A8K0D1E3_IGNLU|nr:hypothetical protein ILUMI_08704 [Ignelater luminosus]
MNTHAIITGTIAQLLVVAIYITTVSGYCSSPSPCASYPNQVPEYYWRDYVGIIPEDAVEGGTDESGAPTYVGQTYIREYGLLPAIVFRGCRTVNTTAQDKAVTSDTNIKILCGKYKTRFQWVPTRDEDLHLLTGRHFIVGGSEVGQALYIGRVNYDNRVIIGKFFMNPPLSKFGLAIPYQGKPVNVHSFEVLTYNVYYN